MQPTKQNPAIHGGGINCPHCSTPMIGLGSQEHCPECANKIGTTTDSSSPSSKTTGRWVFGETRIVDASGSEKLAGFLWPSEHGSVEEAGYEFANAKTEGYRKMVWKELLKRAKAA